MPVATIATVRVVFLEAPEHLLAERERLGLDGRDEMWEGELHMVPPPSFGHQRREARLLRALGPVADEAGLEVVAEAGLYQGSTSWRVPDLVVLRPEQATHRGVEGGAVLVVEIRSPGDETDTKSPFYAQFGVEELLIVERDSAAVTLLRPTDGEFRPVPPDEDGWVRCALGVALRRADGSVLEVRLPDGTIHRC